MATSHRSGFPVGEFTCRSARSGSLVIGLGLVILIETVVMHLWLAPSHPVLAWSLTATSVSAVGWLVADYQALGRGTLRIDVDALDLRVGRRATVRVPLSAVATVAGASWRDLPASGTPESRDYRNLMKPATPNVLVTLLAPAIVRFPGGVVRSVRRLGLRLDDPAGFIAAFDAAHSYRGPLKGDVPDRPIRQRTPASRVTPRTSHWAGTIAFGVARDARGEIGCSAGGRVKGQLLRNCAESLPRAPT